MSHWDNAIEDIYGAFRFFIASALLIFVALAVAKALYPSFPLTNESSGIISVIVGLFVGFVKYIKNKG